MQSIRKRSKAVDRKLRAGLRLISDDTRVVSRRYSNVGSHICIGQRRAHASFWGTQGQSPLKGFGGSSPKGLTGGRVGKKTYLIASHCVGHLPRWNHRSTSVVKSRALYDRQRQPVPLLLATCSRATSKSRCWPSSVHALARPSVIRSSSILSLVSV